MATNFNAESASEGLRIELPEIRGILKKPSNKPATESINEREEKHIKFAPLTYDYEEFDFYKMKWVNLGWCSTIRPSPFAAGQLVPFYLADEYGN
jgi:hypothetical protein